MLNVGWMVQLQRIARFWFAPHSRTTHSSMSIWRANASGTDGLSLSKNETKKIIVARLRKLTVSAPVAEVGTLCVFLLM